MRILHCFRAPVGGLFRHVLDLSAEQARMGHDVGIIADSRAEDALTAKRFADLQPLLTLGIERVAMRREPGLGDIAAARAVLAHARKIKPTIVHGHGAKGGVYARYTARALKKDGQLARAIYTPHGGSLNFKPHTLSGRAVLLLERMMEAGTDGIIFESAYASRIYHKRVNQGRVAECIVPNGLQPSDFADPAFRSDATDFLYVGELREIKGVDVLLKAMARGNATRPAPATLTVVGSGPNSDELKALAASLGLVEPVVTFTGALPIRDALPRGRAMVVPSRSESFPYVVLEAAAAGLPLVATDVGGIPEIVAETDTALVPSEDVDALAAALRAILNDPATAKARAQRLRANVAAKFTVARMAADIVNFYTTRL
ncbi:MAG: glycosyltransferase family 4 protein [Hyphomicrobium sp.]